ncbi:MAG: hypothetical protein ACI8PZ_000359 [Myxococcota bacterium]|jgi:hypothetical protein
MPDGVSVLPRAVYLDLIRGGKIGGTPRTASVEVVHVTDDLATVKGTLDSDSAHFDCVWTVARTDGAWRILQDTVVYAPKVQ